MKLELGAGDRPMPGYVHNDVRELPDIEIVADASQIQDHVGARSCEEIRACHLLEHFSHRDTQRILHRWRNCLQLGGLLHLEVPNLLWQARALALDEPDPSGRRISDEEAAVYVYGEQDHDGNYHKNGFTPDSLKRSLHDAGYQRIEVVDVGQVLVAEARR